MDDSRMPVIVGVGELADRPAELSSALEPVALMAAAARRAEADAGTSLLTTLDGLEIVNEISWPYADIAGLLGDRLTLRSGVEATYHPVGGQTPLIALHRAALAIRDGRWRSALICGAEAQASVTAAERNGVALDWSPRIDGFRPVRGGDYQRPIARALDLATPAHVYPFYENATRAAWGMSFDEAQAESATIWANNAVIAATRDAAWRPRTTGAADIARMTPDNRPIAWPYPKLMTANPGVNQGAAVIVTSVAHARSLGIAQDRMIHFLGGAAADAPRDYLTRTGYDRSRAMEWTLEQASGIVEDRRFDAVELYSCFPCVPKMARRVLGLAVTDPLSVAGGLTFFGAPLNNYMTHACVAMVERLRASGGTGLLYGQGEYVTKHHALVLGTCAPDADLADDYRRDEPAGSHPVTDAHEGIARLESYTILYARDGSIRHGGAIALTPSGERLLARVAPDDAATIARLIDVESEPIGTTGQVTKASDGIMEWRLA